MGSYLSKEDSSVIDTLAENFCKVTTTEDPANPTRSLTDAESVQLHRIIRAKARFGKFVYNMINFLVVFTGVGKHGYKYQLFTPSGSRESMIQLTDKPEKLVDDIIALAAGFLTEEQCKKLTEVVPNFAKECVKLEFMTNEKYADPNESVIVDDDYIQLKKTTGAISGVTTFKKPLDHKQKNKLYKAARMYFGGLRGDEIMFNACIRNDFPQSWETSRYEDWALAIIDSIDDDYKHLDFFNHGTNSVDGNVNATKVVSCADQLKEFRAKKALAAKIAQEAAAAAAAKNTAETTVVAVAETADAADVVAAVATETTVAAEAVVAETTVVAESTTSDSAAAPVDAAPTWSLTESKILLMNRLNSLLVDLGEYKQTPAE